MAKKEPKNETTLCNSVLAHLASLDGQTIETVEQVDSIVRSVPAVEAIYCTKSKHYAVEHTRIESFPGQIGEGKQFQSLFDPVVSELNGKVEGVYHVSVAMADVQVERREQEVIRQALVKWIEAKARVLDADDVRDGNCEIREVPAGVPFNVRLRRESAQGSEVYCFQEVDDLKKARIDAVAASLEKKCPKLATAKAQLQTDQRPAPTSVLILESDDIALSNRAVVADAVVAELAKRKDLPDIVVWARTSTEPWMGFIIKNGDASHPRIDRVMFLLSE